jgi:hypothetical protein
VTSACSAVTQQQKSSVFPVSDQGYIGETEAHLQVILAYFSARGSRGFCEERIYVSYLECETVTVYVLRSVARRRLVETGNPSACATVNCRSV